jgi:hypothetical protein
VRTIFEHSIVGATPGVTVVINKGRGYAACRLCGRVFQPSVNRYGGLDDADYTQEIQFEAEQEILEWRQRHNRLHSEHEHLALAESGLTFTPEAAMALAPLGIVSISDAEVADNAQAMLEAPRQSMVEVETTLQRKPLKGWR